VCWCWTVCIHTIVDVSLSSDKYQLIFCITRSLVVQLSDDVTDLYYDKYFSGYRTLQPHNGKNFRPLVTENILLPNMAY